MKIIVPLFFVNVKPFFMRNIALYYILYSYIFNDVWNMAFIKQVRILFFLLCIFVLCKNQKENFTGMPSFLLRFYILIFYCVSFYYKVVVPYHVAYSFFY